MTPAKSLQIGSVDEEEEGEEEEEEEEVEGEDK